jgi:hypothetical protein
MQNLSSSPTDVVSTQKAAEAMEAVFSARQSGKLTWTQINNVSNGGVFLDGPQLLYKPGADGLVNTSDDTAAGNGVETMRLPGKDQTLNTGDDQIVTLGGYTREVLILDVAGENQQLRSIVVTIKYKNGPTVRTYTLTTYISSYS